MHEHPLLHPRKWRRGLFFNPTCDRHPINLARVSQLPPQNVYPVSSRFASGATYIFLLLPRGTTQVISMLCSSNLNRGVPSCSSDGLARAPPPPRPPPIPRGVQQPVRTPSPRAHEDGDSSARPVLHGTKLPDSSRVPFSFSAS